MKTPTRLLVTLLCAAISSITLASLAAACWQQHQRQGYTTDSNTGQTTVTIHVGDRAQTAP